jgi:uncharacterized membrane protein YfcA
VSLLDAVLIALAGVGAGTINTVVGSGTLVTFPTLLALGYSPVVANVSNTVGLAPGGLSGVFGYRRELAGQRRRLIRLGAASVVGGTAGAVLLVTLPSSAFEAIVPVLIGIGCVLVVVQPWVASRLRDRPDHDRPHGSAGMWVLIMLAGVYGGYFGAGQGVLLLGIMGIALDDDLQRINAVKNVLATVVNTVAAVLFVFIADVSWAVAALVAVGSTVGGLLGASIGRRLPATVFRVLIVVIGAIAIWRLLAT